MCEEMVDDTAGWTGRDAELERQEWKEEMTKWMSRRWLVR